MSQLQENQLFANRYRLVKKLGSGAFSEVWKAEDVKAGNLVVAIKIYAPDKGMDEDGIAIFSQEYALVFNVTHQNLLRPNYFDNNNGSPFLVLPYCSKGSVLKMLGSNPSEQELVMLLRDVASGLAYLHKQNPPIIHQDIKPDNILITESGEYKLTDFGISTRIRSTLRRSVGNTSNAGTMAYMAPERFERNPAPIMASDIWSLGATLFELMTDDAPFGNLGGVSLKSGAEIPEVGGNYSNEFKQLVEACLAKDPWDRPTAEQLAKYADKVLNGENPKAPWQREVQEHPSSSQDLGRPTQRITSSPPQENNFGRTTQRKSEQEQIAQELEQQTIVAKKKKTKLLWLWIALGVVALGGLILFLTTIGQDKPQDNVPAVAQLTETKTDTIIKVVEIPSESSVPTENAEQQRKAEQERIAQEQERQQKAEQERKAQEQEQQRKVEQERKAQEQERQRKAEQKPLEVGSLYTFSDGSKGIVFYLNSYEHGLVVSLDEKMLQWGGYGNDILNIPNEKAFECNKNLNIGLGATYTTYIIDQLGRGNAPAAEWCRAKGSKWYLPSFGELWQLMYVANKDKGISGPISEALKSNGGTGLTIVYWASSECHSNYALSMIVGDYVTCESKTKYNNVRAVRAF